MRHRRMLWGAAVVLGGVATGVPAWAGEPVAPPHLGACGPVGGAFQLPGTDACLRLSGFVAAEIGTRRGAEAPLAPLGHPSVPSAAIGDINRSAITADTRLSADLRIPTEYGPARFYVSVRGRRGVLSSAR